MWCRRVAWQPVIKRLEHSEADQGHTGRPHHDHRAVCAVEAVPYTRRRGLRSSPPMSTHASLVTGIGHATPEAARQARLPAGCGPASSRQARAPHAQHRAEGGSSPTMLPGHSINLTRMVKTDQWPSPQIQDAASPVSDRRRARPRGAAQLLEAPCPAMNRSFVTLSPHLRHLWIDADAFVGAEKEWAEDLLLSLRRDLALQNPLPTRAV